jgi:hypothetical protein
VRQRGSVRRGGKPAYVYELTPEAENLFPKAYEPALGRSGRAARARGIGEAAEIGGPPLGARLSGPRGQHTCPAEGAVGMLNKLGGLAELQERDATRAIRGYSCRWPP